MAFLKLREKQNCFIEVLKKKRQTHFNPAAPPSDTSHVCIDYHIFRFFIFFYSILCTFREFLCMIFFFLSPERRCKYVWFFFYNLFRFFCFVEKKYVQFSRKSLKPLMKRPFIKTKIRSKMIRKTGAYTREVFNSNCTKLDLKTEWKNRKCVTDVNALLV